MSSVDSNYTVLIQWDILTQVTDKMRVLIFFLVVEYSAFVTARDYCYYTSIKPVTTVVNSTHLRISWKDSFNEACDDGKVKNAKLWIRRKRKSYSYDKTAENLPVNFD